MVSKPKVLICIDWFLPGYKAGGPIKSVANIVLNLNDAVDFRIVTGNTDFGEASPYPEIQPNKWLQRQGYKIMYLDKANQNIKVLRKLLRADAYDSIYLNSLFSVPFTLFPLLALKLNSQHTKVILAPRGMLGQGALNIKKTKKKVFLTVARLLSLFKNTTWHASTTFEEAEIKAAFGKKTNVHIATNIASSLGTLATNRSKTPHNTIFFFLSRISPKKNLLGALKLMQEIKLKHTIQFNIIGPVEEELYWKKCQEVIAKLPGNIKVNYLGAVPNPELPTLLEQFHFLLLPTRNENYGHVVVEAWASGCPVIISDQTPWRQLEEAEIGWDVPLDDQCGFVKVLEKCVLMENKQFHHMSNQTQKYLKKYVVTEDIINQNKKLFDVLE